MRHSSQSRPLIGWTKGGMNTKLHPVPDSMGRPIRLFITTGQVSDYLGARALRESLPAVNWPNADRGYEADWGRETLQDKGIGPYIPRRTSRGKAVRYDKRRDRRHNRIEIMLGRLTHWRRIATRQDRCPNTPMRWAHWICIEPASCWRPSRRPRTEACTRCNL